jgi:hypothetical protein
MSDWPTYLLLQEIAQTLGGRVERVRPQPSTAVND